MPCPSCGGPGQFRSPDYGFGYGAEYTCTCRGDNRWSERSEEARRLSANSLALSASNADAYRTRDNDPTDQDKGE